MPLKSDELRAEAMRGYLRLALLAAGFLALAGVTSVLQSCETATTTIESQESP